MAAGALLRRLYFAETRGVKPPAEDRLASDKVNCRYLSGLASSVLQFHCSREGSFPRGFAAERFPVGHAG
jgi:hypothetical protein